MIPGQDATRLGRLRQRWVDRAARRMFERLSASPATYRTSPSSVAAVATAVVVLAGGVAALAFLVWATIHASGPVWIGLVVLGWAAVIVARPRGYRLGRDVQLLDRAEYPAVHEVVASVARAVGVRPPAVIGVDLDFNAYVVSIGRVRRRNALVLGLPMMTLGTWHERLGVLGHELGHLRGRDTSRGRLLGAAASLLAGVEYLVAPSAAEVSAERSWEGGRGGGLLDLLVYVIQVVLVSPVLVVSLLLDRLEASARQHQEYLADRRAAELVGSESVVAFLLRDLEGIQAATAAASRRGEDPFESIRARPLPTSAQQKARLAALQREVHRADATHPPDDLRARLVSANPLPPSVSMPDQVAHLRAEQELERLRRERAAEYRMLLLHSLV